MRSELVRPLVVGLLAVQVVAVALLWLLDAFSQEATAAFAFLLAADLVVFALVAHIYRTVDHEEAKTESHQN